MRVDRRTLDQRNLDQRNQDQRNQDQRNQTAHAGRHSSKQARYRHLEINPRDPHRRSR